MCFCKKKRTVFNIVVNVQKLPPGLSYKPEKTVVLLLKVIDFVSNAKAAVATTCPSSIRLDIYESKRPERGHCLWSKA